VLWGREGLRPSAKSVRHQAASPFVIPAHAGIHRDPAVALDIRTRSRIKLGPSVRWDDGVVDRYFRFFRFFRLAGCPRGGGAAGLGPACPRPVGKSVRHPGVRRDPS
jgi:hypothetical protein